MRLPLLVAGLALAAFAAAGCRNERLLDGPSARRLADIPDGASVLLSLKREQPQTDLPPLGDGARELGRAGASVLLEVSRTAMSTLTELAGVKDVVVWGDGCIVARLAPELRGQMLAALDDPARRREPLSVIAALTPGAADFSARIEAAGGVPRSQVGAVATFDATVDALLQIVGEPEIVELERPAVQRALGGQ